MMKPANSLSCPSSFFGLIVSNSIPTERTCLSRSSSDRYVPLNDVSARVAKDSIAAPAAFDRIGISFSPPGEWPKLNALTASSARSMAGTISPSKMSATPRPA